MKRLVLIGGKSCSGKDTIGKYLCQKYDFKRMAFADKLKDDVAKEYNINRNLFDIQEYKNEYQVNSKTLRELLIDYSFKQKEKDQDIYTKKVLDEINPFDNKNSPLSIYETKFNNIVITDFRFEHEYTFLKKHLEKEYNIYTLLVKKKCTNKYDNDVSENSLNNFKFKYVINNIGDLGTLFKQVDYFMESLF